MNYLSILEEIQSEITSLYGEGKVADYIPALANIDPLQFSMAITLVDGQSYGIGDYSSTFSIQSISKVFSFTMALRANNNDGLYQRVWREPSGDPFNSLVQLEHEQGIPRNPFINAGAIVVCDFLHTKLDKNNSTLDEIIEFIGCCANDNSIKVNQVVANSEIQSGYRNASLANLMKDFGNIDHEVKTVLETYCNLCSVEMSPKQLSRSMLYLANKGIDPLTKNKVLTASQTKRVNALMLTCGHYDASGDFAYNVGLPGKSGVGGGIIAIIPEIMTIAVYSPALNINGNSLIGTKALELFTTKTGLSIF